MTTSHPSWRTVDTPLGPIAVGFSARGLSALTFIDGEGGRRPPRMDGAAGRAGADVAARIEAYFAGDLGALDALALDLRGTDFQRRVWQAVRAIPGGETRSYGQIARQLCRPGGARAVGAANAHNPVALAIPCHRVIGASGQLTGYAYGTARKRWLLEHEGVPALA